MQAQYILRLTAEEWKLLGVAVSQLMRLSNAEELKILAAIREKIEHPEIKMK